VHKSTFHANMLPGSRNWALSDESCYVAGDDNDLCNANSGASLSKLMRVRESKGEGNVKEREREREREKSTDNYVEYNCNEIWSARH